MSIDLKKRIVDLSKKAAFAANKHGIEGQRAQVVLVLDISLSMNALYQSGVVQRVIERMLGLAVSFDDDGQIDLLLFGTNAYPLPPATLDEIEGYVERVILSVQNPRSDELCAAVAAIAEQILGPATRSCVRDFLD